MVLAFFRIELLENIEMNTEAMEGWCYVVVVCVFVWLVGWSAVGFFFACFHKTSRSTTVLFDLKSVLNQASEQGKKVIKKNL